MESNYIVVEVTCHAARCEICGWQSNPHTTPEDADASGAYHHAEAHPDTIEVPFAASTSEALEPGAEAHVDG